MSIRGPYKLIFLASINMNTLCKPAELIDSASFKFHTAIDLDIDLEHLIVKKCMPFDLFLACLSALFLLKGLSFPQRVQTLTGKTVALFRSVFVWFCCRTKWVSIGACKNASCEVDALRAFFELPSGEGRGEKGWCFLLGLHGGLCLLPLLFRSVVRQKFGDSLKVLSLDGLILPKQHVYTLHAGTPRQLTYGFVNESKRILKRKLTAHSSSASQSSSTELSTDGLNDIAGGDGSLQSNSYSDLARSDGKPGFVSFYGLSYQIKEEIQVPAPRNDPSNIFWFVGPTVLVFSLVFPSFYLRRVLLTIFEDSLFTDFLILFVTEALFYAGVAIYVFLIDHVCGNHDRVTHNTYGQMKTSFGLRVFSVAMLVLSLIIPLVTMGMVWPWTGPAASATLAPYLVGLVVQFAFEQYARYRKSTAWAVIPIVFQVYRLHQLNRAAQLVTALSFSVRGIESTAQTVAINNSLGTLLNVLQVLGVICIWSLSSFLMRFLPSSPTVVDP